MNTEIILPLPELKTALSGLNKLIGRKTTLPVLSHVKVSRQKNGLVTLQGTDLDAHATFTLNDTQSGESVDVLVPLELLNKALKCSTGSKQDLALVCEDKSTQLRYFIGGSPIQQPVSTLPVNEWPPMPEITVDSTPLQPGFGEALKQAMECCSEDPTRFVLRGACLDVGSGAGHYVVGTNGRFLYSANSFTFPLKESVIVPDSKFINGSGLLDSEPCFMAVQTGNKPSQLKHICLQNKQWQFVTREIDGQYPNWKQVVPTLDSSWTTIQLGQPAIEQLLKVIPNLPGNDGADKPVRLRIGDKTLWVEGRNKDDQEWTKIAVPDVGISGKARQIALNRDYLLPALKFGLNELAILDELSPMVLSKAGKRMVIMPVRFPAHAAKTEPSKTAVPAPKPSPSTNPGAKPENPQPETNTERKPDMTNTETNKPTNVQKTAPAQTSTALPALDRVESLKTRVREILGDLNDLTAALKAEDKSKRGQEKEIATVRQTLRSLQGVKI